MTFQKISPHVLKKGPNWDFFCPGGAPRDEDKNFVEKKLLFFFRLSMYLSGFKIKTSCIEQVLRYNVLKKVPIWDFFFCPGGALRDEDKNFVEKKLPFFSD